MKMKAAFTGKATAILVLLFVLHSIPSTAGIGGFGRSLNQPDAPTTATEDSNFAQNPDSTLEWHQVLIRVLAGMLAY